MPIISKVESNSTQGKCLHGVILIALTLGGITMVYPFLIMVSGTVRSEMDETDLDIIPQYMVDDEVLYMKFLETKYNQNLDALNRAHGNFHFRFKGARPNTRHSNRSANDLLRFLSTFEHWPRHWDTLGASRGIKTIPENTRALSRRLHARYNGDIAALSHDAGIFMTTWDMREFQPPLWHEYKYDYTPSPIYEEFFTISTNSAWSMRQLTSISGYFVETMIVPIYGRKNTQQYNNAHVNTIDSIDNFILPSRVPSESQATLRTEWIEFINHDLNPSFVRLTGISHSVFQDFVRNKYADIESLNKSWVTSFSSFAEVRLPHREWLSGAKRLDCIGFRATQPYENYVLDGPEYAWRDWLRTQYDSISDLNAAHATGYAGFSEACLPIENFEWQYVLTHTSELRWTYAARNFVNVLDAMFVHGRAFVNTAVLCAMAIVVALIVNPLAAYAMSRFRLPGTYKLLLLLMATMSFPPMVTMIPMFIMLRELHMLNSFWALVLPMAANGYLIFLLKGFFDSLPKDLYEAALIDGSGEFRMFLHITMALSKPILAVVALGAFNAAYTMFLYALIVCPDSDMWLLSVYLFQYQQQVSMGGMYAAVLVAAVPPLVVFLCAQNVIMRGIVVPVEK